MFSKIDNSNASPVYYDKDNMLHYSNESIVRIKIAAVDENRLRVACNIIARLNNFTKSEEDIYYIVNLYNDETLKEIHNVIKNNYSYSGMTINRAINKFLNEGIVRIYNNDNTGYAHVKVNDNFNMKNKCENDSDDIIFALSLI